MKLHPYLLILTAIMVLTHPIACLEIAYSIGLNGEKAVGYANITEYKATDKVSFTVSARGPESASYRTTRNLESIKDEINRKINRGNEPVRDKGLDLVGNKSGAQRIDQICSIYDYMVGNWTFVSDWKGLDEFQYSNYTLKKGSQAGSSGKGDCDDFSILLSALIESIGGTPRIVFAYSPDGGHAYTEVYLGKESNRDVDRMLTWLRTTYNANNVYIHANPENGDVWLNMDWWKDPGGANHPGGPFYRAATQIPMYIKENEDKTPLTSIENILPSSFFTYSPLQPEVDEWVSFDASGSIDPDGKIVDYEWDFGDGETAHGITKSVCRHSYSGSGKFMVNLTVTDNEGDNSTKIVEIDVKEPFPEAIATYSPEEPKVGEVITFDASQSKTKRGEIIEYDWDFDDGYSGNRVVIDHQFLKSGTYNVKLTVITDKGAINSSIINVVISQEVGDSHAVNNDFNSNKPYPINQSPLINKSLINVTPSKAAKILRTQPANFSLVGQIAQLDPSGVTANQVAWSPDGRLLAIASYNLYLYDSQTWKQKKIINTNGWINSVAFSPDGKTLVSASMGSNGVKLWDVAGGEIRTFKDISSANYVAFSPDGRTLAAAAGITIKLFDVESGRELKTLIGHNSEVNSLAFSPDGHFLASGSNNIKLWDVQNGTDLLTFSGQNNWVKSIAFSPDGLIIASGSVDKTIKLWNVISGRELATLTGHTSQVDCVSFSPDGRLIASASWDPSIKLWDVAKESEIRTLTGHTRWIKSVAFSPDGSMLASGSYDSTVRIWGYF